MFLHVVAAAEEEAAAAVAAVCVADYVCPLKSQPPLTQALPFGPPASPSVRHLSGLPSALEPGTLDQVVEAGEAPDTRILTRLFFHITEEEQAGTAEGCIKAKRTIKPLKK